MWFEDNLTEDDVRRATEIPVTPRALAAGHIALLEACDSVCQEVVIPVIQQLNPTTDRQRALVGLFYRIMGFANTVTQLQSPVHQQSLTSAERSVTELWIDMELLHRDIIANGVEKILAFIDFQKLRAARRTVTFFQKHPELDETPSKSTPHHGFIEAKGADVEATARRLWPRADGKAPKPDHWSGISLPERAEKLGLEEELRVLEGYDIRNFAVHTGLTGIMGLDANAFEIMCSQAAHGIAECMMSALRIMGRELNIHAQFEWYELVLEKLSHVALFTVADNALIAKGESRRYQWHKGPPPEETLKKST
jgi:hypothetical protein